MHKKGNRLKRTNINENNKINESTPVNNCGGFKNITNVTIKQFSKCLKENVNKYEFIMP